MNVKSVKGQEFDCVFVLEFDKFIKGITNANDRIIEVNRRKIYMMCARARDNLYLIHGAKQLPQSIYQLIPGPEILKRTSLKVA